MQEWDAVVSHWLIPSSFIVALAGKMTGQRRNIPHLAIAHSGDVHLLSNPLFRPLARRVPKTASSLGFISSNLRNQFLDILGPAAADTVFPMTRIAPMGIELKELVPARPRQEIRDTLGLKNFAVLFLGRMVPIKGLDGLIDALAGQPGFQLIAAGDGPERAALEQRSRNSAVHAQFVGMVDAPRRAELLSVCDALVVPSVVLSNGRCEGLPLVISEAMAAGIPVVASNTGSASELIVHEKTGLLFEQKDKVALLRCLRRLQDDPILYAEIRKAATEQAAKRDWQIVIEDLMPLIGLT
jgi:glycosyltransferase involved in cell wall biosynthesis